MNLKNIVKKIVNTNSNQKKCIDYMNRFKKYSFRTGECKDEKQWEACITRLYHTIEKGLSYEHYRAGFGKDNIATLLNSLERYVLSGGNTEASFYRTALDVLHKYVEKNAEFGLMDENLKNELDKLPGKANGLGGIIEFEAPGFEELRSMNYEIFVKTRHSMRHFSNEEVDGSSIKGALKLAQFTPSACNRQGWKTRIIADKNLLKDVLKNQNGNRGFGEEINKLLLITVDLRYFNYERELHQAYIDGGMYAMSVINGLHYEGLATIPLSAALTLEQEKKVRDLLDLDDSELFILFVGVGQYPEHCRTTRSERKQVEFIVH